MDKKLANKIEANSLTIVHEMSVESLPPDLFEKWESVHEALLTTRKAFKKKDIKEISDVDAQQIGYDSAQSFLDANKEYPNGIGVLSAESFKYLLEAGYYI